MDPTAIDRIRRNGVVGAGGAGFPSHVKFQSSAEIFIVNAAECEPLLHKDKELLKAHSDEILAGMRLAMELVGAKEGVIGIKEKYGEVIALLERRISDGIRLHLLPDIYPAGDEFVLVHLVTGRVIPPGGLPIHVGVLVNNVETLLNIALDRPVTRKYLTVAGHVAAPATVCVPVGTPMREAIELAGGARSSPWAILEGGVMMGRLVQDPDTPVTKTTGGLVVLPDDHPLLVRYRRDWNTINRIGKAACDQCTFCTELCPRYLLGHPIQPHKAMRGLGFMEDRIPQIVGTAFCCECNLCSMIACPENLDPKNVCAQFKQETRLENIHWEGEAREPHPIIDDRRVPLSRLFTKLDLNRFENVGPLISETVEPRSVRLPVKQHVGAPGEARVKVGDRVVEGDVVAEPPSDALGVPVHASISGRVTEVGDSIVIEVG